MVRREECGTPTHLIKIPNLHVMDMLLKIDLMMADAVRTGRSKRRNEEIGNGNEEMEKSLEYV